MTRSRSLASYLALATVAAVAIGTPAQAAEQCWYQTDPTRGFGYFDSCGDVRLTITATGQKNTAVFHGPNIIVDEGGGGAGDGAAGGGGGGGGNR